MDMNEILGKLSENLQKPGAVDEIKENLGKHIPQEQINSVMSALGGGFDLNALTEKVQNGEIDVMGILGSLSSDDVSALKNKAAEFGLGEEAGNFIEKFMK
jgi:hypothetical protein